MRKGFTLIELIITLVVIGIVASVVIIPIVGMSGGLFPNYSEGERSGTVYKLSKKGMIWKSYEGEMNLGGMAADANGQAVVNKFEFSVRDDEVIKAINEASTSGKRVTLYYTQYWMKPIKIDTPFIINKVVFMKDNVKAEKQ